MLFVLLGDNDQASIHLNESMALWYEVGIHGVLLRVFSFWKSRLFAGRYQAGERVLKEALRFVRELGNLWMVSIILASLAMVATDEGNYRQAGALLTESLTILREIGERWQIVHTLEGVACLAAAQGGQLTLLQSARLFGAAEKLRESLAAPVLPFQRDFNERGVARLHVQLDAVTLRAGWAEGRAMTLDQAVLTHLRI